MSCHTGCWLLRNSTAQTLIVLRSTKINQLKLVPQGDLDSSYNRSNHSVNRLGGSFPLRHNNWLSCDFIMVIFILNLWSLLKFRASRQGRKVPDWSLSCMSSASQDD